MSHAITQLMESYTLLISKTIIVIGILFLAVTKSTDTREPQWSYGWALSGEKLYTPVSP